MLENESQGTFDQIFTQASEFKAALGALSQAVGSELRNIRAEVCELRGELRGAVMGDCTAAAAATQAVAQAQKALVELSVSTQRRGGDAGQADAELRAQLEQLKREHAELQAKHARLLEDGSSKASATDAIEAMRAELQATREQLAQLRGDHTELRAQHAQVREQVSELKATLEESSVSSVKEADGLKAALEESVAAKAASTEGVAELAAAVRAVEQEVSAAQAELEMHRNAIQHAANMVSDNSREDEVTAERLNARIDGVTSLVEEGRAAHDEHAMAVEAEHVKVRQAVQVIADLVTENSKADEVTAASLNERIDALAAQLGELMARQNERPSLDAALGEVAGGESQRQSYAGVPEFA